MRPLPPSLRAARASRGFTLIELLTVIAILGILIAILFPVISRAKAAAKNSVCLSNLRQIALLSQAYSADNHGMIVPCADQSGASTIGWYQLLAPYLGDQQASTGNYVGQVQVLYGCPSYANNATSGNIEGWLPGYAENAFPGMPSNGNTNWVYAPESGKNAQRYHLAAITSASQRIFFGESNTKDNVSTAADFDLTRHGDHSNALFFDFHVAALASTTQAATNALYGQISTP